MRRWPARWTPSSNGRSRDPPARAQELASRDPTKQERAFGGQLAKQRARGLDALDGDERAERLGGEVGIALGGHGATQRLGRRRRATDSEDLGRDDRVPGSG